MTPRLHDRASNRATVALANIRPGHDGAGDGTTVALGRLRLGHDGTGDRTTVDLGSGSLGHCDVESVSVETKCFVCECIVRVQACSECCLLVRRREGVCRSSPCLDSYTRAGTMALAAGPCKICTEVNNAKSAHGKAWNGQQRLS